MNYITDEIKNLLKSCDLRGTEMTALLSLMGRASNEIEILTLPDQHVFTVKVTKHTFELPREVYQTLQERFGLLPSVQREEYFYHFCVQKNSSVLIRLCRALKRYLRDVAISFEHSSAKANAEYEMEIRRRAAVVLEGKAERENLATAPKIQDPLAPASETT